MTRSIEIAGRAIGPGHPPFVICELSGNHNGQLDRALALIDAAAATGADAIKIQSYTADTITIDHDGPGFTIEGGLWDGRRLHELYAEAQTPFEWHPALFERARKHGVTMFSSPFDQSAVDMLETLDCPAYKIASFEIVDLPLIARVASTGKPMIISTGMANVDEIGTAVETARANGCDQIVLLHCVSSYPAPDEQSNLRTIPDLAERFGTVVGLSDHTHGTAVAVASIALGASVIEKHFTLRRSDGGPDAAFSLEPEEFRALVEDCRRAWTALGTATYELQGCEAGSLQFRRSLYVVADVAKGELLTAANVRSIRPGFGLPPGERDSVIGRRAARDLRRGDPLARGDIADD